MTVTKTRAGINNNNSPGGMWKKKNIAGRSKAERDDLIKQLEDEVGGTKNEGKVVFITDADTEFTPITYNNREAQIVPFFNELAREIILAMRAPIEIFSSTSSNRATAQAALDLFHESTIVPLLDVVRDFFNKYFIESSDAGLRFTYKMPNRNPSFEDIREMYRDGVVSINRYRVAGGEEALDEREYPRANEVRAAMPAEAPSG